MIGIRACSELKLQTRKKGTESWRPIYCPARIAWLPASITAGTMSLISLLVGNWRTTSSKLPTTTRQWKRLASCFGDHRPRRWRDTGMISATSDCSRNRWNSHRQSRLPMFQGRCLSNLRLVRPCPASRPAKLFVVLVQSVWFSSIIWPLILFRCA